MYVVENAYLCIELRNKPTSKDNEIMTEKDLHLGMVVCGRRKYTNEWGRIKEIKFSNGSRKGLIYKVGIEWFFADEICIDWFCILILIGKGNTCELKTPFKFTCGGKKVVATKVAIQDNYEIIGDGFRQRLYSLRKPTVEKLYWQIAEELGIYDC